MPSDGEKNNGSKATSDERSEAREAPKRSPPGSPVWCFKDCEKKCRLICLFAAHDIEGHGAQSKESQVSKGPQRKAQ